MKIELKQVKSLDEEQVILNYKNIVVDKKLLLKDLNSEDKQIIYEFMNLLNYKSTDYSPITKELSIEVFIKDIEILDSSTTITVEPGVNSNVTYHKGLSLLGDLLSIY